MIPEELKNKFMEMSKKMGLPEELITQISEALSSTEDTESETPEEAEVSVAVVWVEAEEETDDIDDMSEEEAKAMLRKLKGNKKSAKNKLLEQRASSY